jgi:hypothetical protein
VQDQHNRPEVADNRATVRLECTDAGGAVLVSGSHRWPLTDTDGGITEAHIHQPVPADDVEDVESCRLADTEPELRGPSPTRACAKTGGKSRCTSRLRGSTRARVVLSTRCEVIEAVPRDRIERISVGPGEVKRTHC